MINNLITSLPRENGSSSILNRNEVYNFNSNNTVRMENISKRFISVILYSYFKKFYCLISKPTFTFTNDKIIIHLMYYRYLKDVKNTPRNVIDTQNGKRQISLRTDSRNNHNSRVASTSFININNFNRNLLEDY